jgi:hypothetical protein
MLNVLAGVTDRVLDRFVPNITAEALSAVPAGCEPECRCAYLSTCSGCDNSKGQGCGYQCTNLNCRITYTCGAGTNGLCSCGNCTS